MTIHPLSEFRSSDLDGKVVMLYGAEKCQPDRQPRHVPIGQAITIRVYEWWQSVDTGHYYITSDRANTYRLHADAMVGLY